MTREEQAYQKQWRADHREELKAYHQAWYQENKERVRLRNLEYRKKNREKYRAAHRARQIRGRYGIEAEEFDRLMIEQQGLCKICHVQMVIGGLDHDSVCIDHDHETGRVRGLLCHRCNLGLGGFRDKMALVQAALDYLKAAKLAQESDPECAARTGAMPSH